MPNQGRAGECPPHGPYRRHPDGFECMTCGDDVGWSPLAPVRDAASRADVSDDPSLSGEGYVGPETKASRPPSINEGDESNGTTV